MGICHLNSLLASNTNVKAHITQQCEHQISKTELVHFWVTDYNLCGHLFHGRFVRAEEYSLNNMEFYLHCHLLHLSLSVETLFGVNL